MSKLEDLAEIYGMEVMEMLEHSTFDSISPGICTNEGCDYTTDIEPDCRDGWCENCETNTVKSCLVLGGIM